MNKAIFLDRDGVLNESIIKNGKPYPPANLDELIIPDDVLPTLQTFKSMGYLLIVVTNQPDVARGTQKREVIESINAKLSEKLPLDEINVCYHDDSDKCDCRKPNPGFLLVAAKMLNIDLSVSYMIGDRWRDIEAGRKAGCTTIHIDRNYSEEWKCAPPHYTISSLNEALRHIKQ